MGRAAVATLAFRVGGELRVAAVVKATFLLAPDGPMSIADPEPIVRADVYRDDSPLSSLVAAADLVPYRSRANVFLTGHARAPLERPTPAMAVRLMMARGRDLVLDKRLAVRGGLDPSGRTREPAPFSAIRFGWEVAAATADNPVGIREGAGVWPHVVDPRRRDRAAGFGPISARWPSRRRFFPAADGVLAARIPELPGDFAWAYFDAAPEDQRVDFLRGDEWVGFEGMSSQLPRVQSCLPGVRARASVYGAAPELRAGRPLPLAADTLSIDADHLLCSVVWRGSFPVAREQDLAALHVFAGVETAGAPLSFPATYAVQPTRTPAAPPPPDMNATVSVGQLISPFAALPFAPAAEPPRSESAPRPPARPAPPSPLLGSGTLEIAPPAPDMNATMAVGGLLSPFAALPFTSAAEPPRPPPPPLASATVEIAPPAADMNATMAVGGFLSPFAALPFAPTAAPPPRTEAQRPLPAATPFEQGRRVTPPPGSQAAVTPAPLVARALPPEPIAAVPGLPTTIADPPEVDEGEPPTTLGGFFLAAMARAARSHPTSSAASTSVSGAGRP